MNETRRPGGRFWALCAWLGVALLAGGGCGRAPGGGAGGDLRVGMELAYPPFEMTDSTGKPAGVSVDLAGALAAHLGRPVRIVNIPFDGLIPALKTGKIDLIISSLTATGERAKSIAFSDPYLRTGLCLLVGKASGIDSIDDADQPGRTIAVKQGTTGHLYAQGRIRQAKIRVLDQETNAVLEVVQGRCDAFIYDQMSVYQNWRRHPETTRPILKPFQEESWAVGLRQDDADLRAKVNKFLADFKAGGGFERLGDKYLREQKQAFKELGYPFFF